MASVCVCTSPKPRAQAPIDNPVCVRLSSNYNHCVLYTSLAIIIILFVIMSEYDESKTFLCVDTAHRIDLVARILLVETHSGVRICTKFVKMSIIYY